MITWQITLLRIVLAALLGSIIGLERERKGWSAGAGMRTHMMVCIGSALIIIVSAFGFSDVLGNPNIVLDPSRIAAQVVSGIGFLGAGTILFLRPGLIKGLTTASALWVVAAIGLAVGAGMYLPAIITTVIAFIVLYLLKPLENRISKHIKQHHLRLSVDAAGNPSAIIDHLLKSITLTVNDFTFEKSADGFIIEIEFENFEPNKCLTQLMEIEKLEGVKEVYWNGR